MTRRELLQKMAAAAACSVVPLNAMATGTQRHARLGNILVIAAGLEHGTVSSFLLRTRGAPLLLSQRPLSFTAHGPSHVAISRTSRAVAVCSSQGHVIDLLPMEAGGMLRGITAVHRRVQGTTPAMFVFREDGALQVDDVLLHMRNGQLVRV